MNLFWSCVLAVTLLIVGGEESVAAPAFLGDAGARATAATAEGHEDNSGSVSVSASSGTNSAYADLRTGKLGAKADLGSATAGITDYLYFTGSAGAASFTATVRLEVDGILLACQHQGGDSYCAQPNFDFLMMDGVAWSERLSVGWRCSGCVSDRGLDEALMIDFGGGPGDTPLWTVTGQHIFERVMNIPFNTVIGLTMIMGGDGPFDFSHTAIFNWTLPEGVQFQSTSGAFLAGDVTSPIDEPAGFAVLLAGLGVLAAQRMRQGRTG